jgi:hypothetical protein
MEILAIVARKEAKMKKRVISIILVIVLICSLSTMVSADACHHVLYYEKEIYEYAYLDEFKCTRYISDLYLCYLCDFQCKETFDISDVDHLFGPMMFLCFYQGMQWWYQDCLNCFARVDYFFE